VYLISAMFSISLHHRWCTYFSRIPAYK